MEKITTLTGPACPLGLSNVDTDQLLPARFLKFPRSKGLGQYLLHDLRFDGSGAEKPDFPLNRPARRHAKILVAGRNFGGGSSREGAVYALYDYGIRCVIAPSFGDIFSQNATKNGLLTATVSEADCTALTGTLNEKPDLPVTVDLERQAIEAGGKEFGFTIDPARRTRLLHGWDDIDLTRSHAEAIAAFRRADLARRPWAAPRAAD